MCDMLVLEDEKHVQQEEEYDMQICKVLLILNAQNEVKYGQFCLALPKTVDVFMISQRELFCKVNI